MISENEANLFILTEKVLDFKLKSVCAVAMYIHWTCININKKDNCPIHPNS